MQMEIICFNDIPPHEPPLQASSKSNNKNVNWIEISLQLTEGSAVTLQIQINLITF